MLQLINNAIVEDPAVPHRSCAEYDDFGAGAGEPKVASTSVLQGNSPNSGISDGLLGSYTVGGCWPYNDNQTIHWNSYPVYVCTDKTAKAIGILKSLQADKIIEVNSVPKFIELVEKIAGIL